MMSPFRFVLLSIAIAGVALASGCKVTPDLPDADRVLRAQAQSQLPANWLSVSKSDWRYQELPDSARSELEAVKSEFDAAKQSAGYSFYGRYSEALAERALQANRDADAAFIQAYLSRYDPAEVVMRNPTPELMGMSERPIDVERNMAVVGNQNLRMMWGDLGRVWLFDQPSQLSPWNTVSTSGQP